MHSTGTLLWLPSVCCLLVLKHSIMIPLKTSVYKTHAPPEVGRNCKNEPLTAPVPHQHLTPIWSLLSARTRKQNLRVFLDRNHVPASPRRLLRVHCSLSKGNELLITVDQANVPPDEYADTTSGVLWASQCFLHGWVPHPSILRVFKMALFAISIKMD